jgi:mannose-6-phosphate isomerase-like protein (cupin superfamily)
MSDYQNLRLDEIRNAVSPASQKLEIDEAVDATEFGVNIYQADPGEQIPWGYHRHPDHEELFLVLDGTLKFETPDGSYTVGADEVFFVPRDHSHRARAVGDTSTRVIAIGAPKAHDDAIIEEECPNCGEVTRRKRDVIEEANQTVYVLMCEECGTETMRVTPPSE